MVAFTGTQIATRVKRQFGDESGAQIVDSDIIMWLNDAMREAVTQNSGMNLKTKTVASIQGRAIYDLPDILNTAAVHSIQFNQDAKTYYPLRHCAPSQFDEMFPGWDTGFTGSANTGSPVFYSAENNARFKVYPAPNTTDGLGFKVKYNSFYCEVEELEKQMTVSARYYQYLLEYCLMKAYELDENWEAADRKAAYIQSTLNVLATTDLDQNQTVYPSISVNVEDM